MKILILGSTGMAGQALAAEARKRGFEAFGVARESANWNIDLSNYQELSRVLREAAADLIINAAACVSNLECEKNPGRAYCINARPAGAIAEYTRASGSYFVQISTDHYFTGNRDAKHSESYPVRLVNEYARTKYLGESLAATDTKSLIIRTNIVGFRNRQGQPAFVEWALKAIRERQPLNLFSDFFTSSMDVAHFSKAVFDLIEKRPAGVLNVASREVASKERFIRALAARFGYDISHATVGSVKSQKETTHAESLGLDVAKAEALLGYELPTLEEVIEMLFQTEPSLRKHDEVSL